ncbi:response regulator transcription factor [Dechloromonas sp. XY25]|uniref:Response regulator transcription factor n=1 Tax=Dechloromonas hankyongensis TaxID=2908002 RepID=A0ABS9K670_9RHOO|nr:response regulator transcription factor [Dechloromonas hankyongensis]MCG2578670.1 response regulator transcription factor [Dechloromonas hankyongensis]
MKVRVLLADDHQLFREALRVMLEKEPSIRVVAETGDGLQVMPLAQSLSPDVVCMDISMPGMNGIETTRRLRAACPDIKIIGLSAFSDQRYILEMLNAGASGYVTKAAAGDQLLQAIATVLQEQKYLCPDATTAISRVQPELGDSAGQADRLGPRERQVLQLVAEGHTSAQIAGHLQMAPSTVEVHRRNIMRKLNLHNVADLTKYAIRVGLTSS